jgi:hypothetical protein
VELRNIVKSFQIRNLQAGNELTRTMKSGEMVISGEVIPFVLRSKTYGKIDGVKRRNVLLVVINHGNVKKTMFIKAGYCPLSVVIEKCQFLIYVKNTDMEKLDKLIKIANF